MGLIERMGEAMLNDDDTMQDKQPATIDGESLKVLPHPRDIRLKTADDVRLELARVYRDMRAGRIETSDGTKLAFVLGHLTKAIEAGTLADRLEMLELTLKNRKIK